MGSSKHEVTYKGQDLTVYMYNEPAEPATWDYPGYPGALYMEEVLDSTGNSVDGLTDEEWEELESIVIRTL